MNNVLLLSQIKTITVDTDFLAMMTMQTKNNKKITTAVVAYDELDSEIMQ